MLVPSWWTDTTEYAGIYHMPTPWLYIYYSRWMKEASDVQQRTYEWIAMRQFVLLGVPVILATARWGLYAVDFPDHRLGRVGNITRPCIGNIRKLFRWALSRGDPLQIRRGVARMTDAERNLLFMETILEVDWRATYQGISVVATGMYVYYDYETGRVEGWPSFGTLRAVTPVFRTQTRTTLQHCEVEVQRLLGEDRQQRRAVEEVEASRTLDEERGQAVSALWRTVFTRGEMPVPKTTGEAVEQMTEMLRDRQERQT